MIPLLRNSRASSFRNVTSRLARTPTTVYRHFRANERCYWPATCVSGVRGKGSAHRDSNHVCIVCRIEGKDLRIKS